MAFRRPTKKAEKDATFDELCAEIRALLDDIPQERWVWSCNKGSAEHLVEVARIFFMGSDLEEMWGVALDDNTLKNTGDARMVCFTGNGPNSRKHARLLMLVRAVLPELLDRASRA